MAAQGGVVKGPSAGFAPAARPDSGEGGSHQRRRERREASWAFSFRHGATLLLGIFWILLDTTSSAADIVCPDSNYCIVEIRRTYPPESQFAGQPYDYITIAPNLAGQTFFDVNVSDEGDGLADIEIRVYLRNCQGVPLGGAPAHEIVVWGPNLCICPGGNDADAATDVQGCTRFTGTIQGGGCEQQLAIFAEGVWICSLETASGRRVKVNSTDAAHRGTSPCYTDASDLATLATVLGRPANAAPPLGTCYDYNDVGTNIDASDLAYFATFLGAQCQ